MNHVTAFLALGVNIRLSTVSHAAHFHALLEGDERIRLVKGLLCHTLATNLLLNGADVTLVQKQLRHRDIKSTMIYLHITTEKQKELYDRFSPGY